MANILHQLEREEDDANLAFLRSEVERLRLTDPERVAISRIYDLLNERSRELQVARRIEESTPYVQLAKTLQTMWERLK